MNETEKFDACMRIVETMASIRKGRQDYEWKFTISFWTLIALAIATKVPTLDSLYTRLWIATVALTLYTVLWLIGVHWAHVRDRKIGRHYLEQAEEILAVAKIPKPIVSNCAPFNWWGAIFQFFVTLILLGVYTFNNV